MSKTLKLYRYSGEPVDISARDAYDADFKRMYDVAEAKAERVFQKKTGKLQTTPKMIILNRMIQYGERQLTKKHGAEVILPLPKSSKAWYDLISKYEGIPVMVAQRSDRKEIVLIIMDRLNG